MGDDFDRDDLIDMPKTLGVHVHEYRFLNYCGARVCDDCGDHKGLDRCYCGWTRSGGNGYRELVEMGETIDEDY